MYLQIKLYPIRFTSIAWYTENSVSSFTGVTENENIVYVTYSMESPLLLYVEIVLN